MNKIVTSREQLLAAAKKIALKKGLDHINIRAVAAECKVSVGSIYNYFPTKTDLMFSLIDGFWEQVFSGNQWKKAAHGNFVASCREYYDILKEKLSAFEQGWLMEISLLSAKDKQRGRQWELKWFTFMKEEIYSALERDDSIRAGLWSTTITKQGLTDFIFRNMMTMLKQGEEFTFFEAVLNALLY